MPFLLYTNRRKANRLAAEAMLEKLKDNRLLQSFLQEAEELGLWVVEKMVVAQEETYDGARSLHSKWQKHQAFEAELVANKERLDKLKEVCILCQLFVGLGHQMEQREHCHSLLLQHVPFICTYTLKQCGSMGFSSLVKKELIHKRSYMYLYGKYIASFQNYVYYNMFKL